MDYLKQIAKQALKYEAKLVLKKYKPKVVAITGSVGKTLTKEAVYHVLSKNFFVRRSGKSFTAELGIPLAIIGCGEGVGSVFQLIKNLLFGLRVILTKSNYPQWLILEVDGDKPGDLEAVSSMIKPDMVVITAIGETPSHIEMFGDLETFLNEKKAMVDSVRFGGAVIYNADDSITLELSKSSKVRTVSVGVLNGSQISGTEFEILYGSGKTGSVPTGMSFSIKYKNEVFPINIFETIGIQNQYAILLAFAVGLEFGLPASQIVNSLGKYSALPGRMRLVPGVKDTLIIDDSYNSSPIAIEESIRVLKDIKSVDKKIAVIGDMLELGRFSAIEHRRVAELLNGVATDVICIGIRARKIVDELLNYGFPESKIISFDTADEAQGYLQNLINEGDIILIKGSQAMRMEKIVEEVMRYPQDKNKVLVRQEEEWKGR
ncbi:MAG: UDP-N-acetylmuramoyl-tripeptide--D-alanyl-D-alanine ligase [Parcubacteria bacterium C7867-006]|nr:MAG: UDP-N-acetylmuramoyl-tripeptide--D-alanyl-D-alanine ligase [Parcubacteria bacterium C7867-006]